MPADSGPLADALALAGLGWPVFPVRLGTKGSRVTKTPMIRAWQTAASTDPDAIRAMPWDGAGTVGVALPEGVAAVDVDDPAAFEAAGLELPETCGQRTQSGGYHRLYAADGRPVRQTVKEVPGADTRVGGRGYLAVWEPWAFRPADLSPAPEWLYDLAPSPVPAAEAEPMSTRAELLSWLGRLRSLTALDQAQLLALLRDARAKGQIVDSDPAWPWSDKDLAALAREAAKWAPGQGPTMPTITLRRAEPAPEDEAAPRLWTPLAEVDGSLPPPLLAGRVDPLGQTILFGMGGTGKGVVAADWAVRLVDEGRRVLVLDFESHADEWRRRVGVFGRHRHLEEIAISEPYRVGLRALIHDRTFAAIERMVAEHGADLLIVDSIVMACGVSDSLDSRTAGAYSAAIQALALPSLHLGHSTKADGQDARYPFGSIFWHNWARVTWGLYAPDDEEDSPRKLWMRKSNTSMKQRPEAIAWDWVSAALPPRGGLRYSSWSSSDVEAAMEALTEAGGDLPFGDLVDAVAERTGKDPLRLKRSLSSSLSRSPKFASRGDGTWGVAVSGPRVRTVSKEADNEQTIADESESASGRPYKGAKQTDERSAQQRSSGSRDVR